jgi:hypothetical protein
MSEPAITADDVLLRARAAGVTLDPAHLPAVVKAMDGALGALRQFDARAEKWTEPPVTLDPRLGGYE